jgi:hypothetical protein
MDALKQNKKDVMDKAHVVKGEFGFGCEHIQTC